MEFAFRSLAQALKPWRPVGPVFRRIWAVSVHLFVVHLHSLTFHARGSHQKMNLEYIIILWWGRPQQKSILVKSTSSCMSQSETCMIWFKVNMRWLVDGRDNWAWTFHASFVEYANWDEHLLTLKLDYSTWGVTRFQELESRKCLKFDNAPKQMQIGKACFSAVDFDKFLTHYNTSQIVAPCSPKIVLPFVARRKCMHCICNSIAC